MKVAGIVVEYNPFHTGHAHQIAATRAELGGDCAVVAVMSGNWAQQADCAVADKWSRARLALMGGVDLVLELPTVWAMSSAESFARGAVSILHACGVVDAISFGSECGDVEALCRVAECLDSEAYRVALAAMVDKGESFAVCRQRAVEQVLGKEPGGLLAKPNNNLGVEYIRALNALESGIEPMTVLRKGAGHNQVTEEAEFRSATQLRGAIADGTWDEVERFLPDGGLALLKGTPRPDAGRVERAILARLRTMTAEAWAKLPDSGEAEGLTQRLERAGKTCTDLADFFEKAKTKRFTHARLRRLVLWAYLGLTAADVPETPPYIRVLGFNERGREVLARMRKKAALPIITKPAHAKRLDGDAQRLFELERRCTDLYDLCMETVPAPGSGVDLQAGGGRGISSMRACYINFYFKKLLYDDDYFTGEFSDPDTDVYCEFEFNRHTEECRIWNNSKPEEDILPLPVWWLKKKLRENGTLNENEGRICY